MIRRVTSAGVCTSYRTAVVERVDHRVILNEICPRDFGEEEHGGREQD